MIHGELAKPVDNVQYKGRENFEKTLKFVVTVIFNLKKGKINSEYLKNQ